MRLGFEIPFHIFGPGFRIAYRGIIVASSLAIIGENCNFQVCASIGVRYPNADEVPVIGNSVAEHDQPSFPVATALIGIELRRAGSDD